MNAAINSTASSMFTPAALAHGAIVLILGIAIFTWFWYKFAAVSRLLIPDEAADLILRGGAIVKGAIVFYILALAVIYSSTILYGFLLWQFQDKAQQSILNWSAVYFLEFIAFFTATPVAMVTYRLIIRFGERRHMIEMGIEMEMPNMDRSYFGLPEEGSFSPPPRYGEDAPPPYSAVAETTV